MGLCVSVLIDATVIRAFVVPAVMALAGRWNWYPGRYRRPQITSYVMGRPQRASTLWRSRSGGNTSLFKSVPWAS